MHKAHRVVADDGRGAAVGISAGAGNAGQTELSAPTVPDQIGAELERFLLAFEAGDFAEVRHLSRALASLHGAVGMSRTARIFANLESFLAREDRARTGLLSALCIDLAQHPLRAPGD